MKPKIRDKFNTNLKSLIERPYDHIFQTCLSCDHWNEEKEICNKYNIRPPAPIIVFACPDYCDDNHIPF